MKKIGTFQYSTRGDARVNAGIPTVAESTTSWDTSQQTELSTSLHPIVTDCILLQHRTKCSMMYYKVSSKTANVFLLCKRVASAVFDAAASNVTVLLLLLTYEY